MSAEQFEVIQRNVVHAMTVKGHNILRWPYASVDDFKAKPGMSALPFVGPWIGRLDEQAFYANGKRYAFDMELGTVRGAVLYKEQQYVRPGATWRAIFWVKPSGF